MTTYHGGPFDGDDLGGKPLTSTIERMVGSFDVTPDHIINPQRRIDVSAIYRWDGDERLDFDGLRAEYRVVRL